MTQDEAKLDERIANIWPFPFEGQQFELYELKDGRYILPIYRVCEAIGLTPGKQVERITDDEILGDFCMLVSVPFTAKRGKTTYQTMREIACLDLEMLEYWMGTINMRESQAPEIRARMKDYKLRFVKVAHMAFRTEFVDPELRAELDSHNPPSEMEQLGIQAGVTLNQIITELHQSQNLTEFTNAQLDKIRKEIEEIKALQSQLSQRINSLSLAVNSNAAVTHEQANQLKKIIDTFVTKHAQLVRQNKMKPIASNPYGYFWGTFKDEFNLADYHSLRSNEYGEALTWLRSFWYNTYHTEPPG